MGGKGLEEGLHTLITEHAPPQTAPGILSGLGAFKCPLVYSHPTFCITLSPILSSEDYGPDHLGMDWYARECGMDGKGGSKWKARTRHDLHMGDCWLGVLKVSLFFFF